jgi:predicted Zn-dependent peptidase
MRRCSLLFLLLLPLAAQDLKEFEKKVTEFDLPNGLHFIIIERHDAPVVSFHSYVNAGAVDDPKGLTGLAHMFEHMAFKGTEKIGSRNYPAEKAALAEVERIYDKIDALKRAAEERHQQLDARQMQDLQAQLKAAIDKANSYVIPNQYDEIVESNGGVGMNASTSEDSTNYFYSFPSNRLEMWFLLESERFLDPVFREFYKERDVVREERRMRIESSPQGQLVEGLSATAFIAHPYKNPAAGWASDIESLRVKDATAFFKTYYVPGNLTIGIAGDVNPAEARRLADKYFARIPAGPLPPYVNTVEPPQTGERRIEIQTPAQPLVILGFKRPNQNSRDDVVFDVISEILSGGRTGMLYTDLVRDKKLALEAGALPSYPGSKYNNLFLFFLVPNLGHSNEENEKECYAVIDRLKNEKVDAETLDRVKTKLRAGLIRRLDSNSGLAAELTAFHVAFGNWRRLFTQIDDYNKITAEDVQRVARQYLVTEARTVAFTIAPPQSAAPAKTSEARHE